MTFQKKKKKKITKWHNTDSLQIPKHLYKTLIIRGCGSGKYIHYLI